MSENYFFLNFRNKTWFENLKCLALVVFMILAFSQSSWAQSTANYAFTTNSTSSLALDANGNTVDMSSGTTQLVGAGLDAAASVVNNIGFNFVFMGTNFTQFSVNEDGQLKLGSVVVGTNSYGITGGTAAAPLLTALNADFRTGTTTGKVHYKLVGTAPNRTLVVEFKDMQIFYMGAAAAGNSTWQMRLYETSGNIEYVYGTVNAADISAANRTPTIGFYTGGTSNQFASVLYASQTVSTTTPYTINPIVSAVGDFTGLSSAANGSRRAYKFTPPVPAGPTGLAFSAVTTAGMTLNWTAASPTTNIVRYIVLISTNGGVTYNFLANVALGTNTYAATGLIPGTTYDWKVIAVSEGAESTAITGAQATAAGAAYYWVGTTGGNWNTPANWNTAANNTGSTRTVVATSDVLIVDGDGTAAGGSTTINVDLASFTIGQLIVNSNTNLTLQSNSATTRTITVSGGPSDDFVIESGSALSLTNATNAVAFAFSGTGSTGLIAGTLNIGGGAGNTFNSTGGTGTLVTVAATGVINNSFAGNTGVTGSVATLSFLDGSAYNVSGATTTAPNIPLATWGTNSTLTISGLTSSTTSPTNNNQSFGNLVFNCPTLTSSYPFFTTTTTSVIKGNLSVTTGSGQLRTVSTGTLNVLGNVNVLAGKYSPFSGAGTVIVGGNTVIASGSIFDLSLAAGMYAQRGATFTNNGTIAGPNSTTVSTLYFFPVTPTPQIWNGSGAVTPALNTVSLNNTSGLTISQPGPISLLRANLFAGNIVGSDRFTFGTGAALATVIQVGSAGSTDPGGVLVSAPSWNLGTGTMALLYSQSLAYTATNEIPPTRTVTNVTLNNTNGVTLTGGPLEVSGTLTLTAGNFTTSAANLLSLGTASAAGTLTGGSATSYINGPFARTIASGNANSNYILYPVGKTAYNPVSLAPATTAVSIMKAEAFDANAGTTDASILTLSSKRWEAPIVSGSVTNVNARLGDAGIGATNIPVQGPSAAGIYTNAFGSTATYAAGTPNTTTSNTPLASGSYTGFLAYAVSNSCSGTPTPGATTTTASTICLGGSVTLGITTTPVGSGVTYQWQSSTDGVSYGNIASATNSTYVASPTVATYYQCVVTCSAGPVSGTSTPIQITFTNNITGTTPGTRCGTGTVNLAATASSGTINWYDAAAGGNLVGTGSPFSTPSISANTTYYVAAESGTTGSATIGADVALTGATAQPTAFCNRWPNYWSQTIYTAAELKAAGLRAGNITSMAYNIATLGDAATNPNFTVKIGAVAGTNFASTTFLSTAAYTTVYGPATYTHTASGWQTITFATPYVWDGVSNIVINVTHDGADLTNNSQTYYTATADNKVLWVNSYTGSTTTGTTSVNRLNVIFGGQVACSSPRVAVTATVTTPPVFALSSGTASLCNGSSSSAITIATGAADYDTYVWSPATDVTGNAGSGWVFNPTATTTYTLTASQSSGSLCSASATVTVTVNALPSVVNVSPASASVCEGAVQVLTATGGNSVGSGSSTIGSATTLTTATTQPTAFCNRFEHYWSQMVFTAAELTAAGVQAGNINSIKFNITTLGDGTNVSSFKVYMAHTASTTLTGFTTTGLVQVFSAATYNHTVGVNTIVFDTPFAWDGTSNVIVDIRQTGLDLTNNAQTYYTATPDNKTVYAVTSTTFASSDAYAASNPAATTSVNRLNTTFDWSSSVANPITWAPTTDLYTDAAATIPYTGTNASTVYFKSSTIGAASYTATATSAATCTRSASVGLTVTANRTVALTSAVGTDAQTVCINSPITNITYALSNETNANVTGLPAGVTGVYSSGLFTISGTPTAAGTFNYTITPVGCGTATATGSIVVNQTAQPTASSQTFCNAATVADLTAAGTAIQWYAGPSGGSALASTDALATGTYYVTQTVSGCESSRLAVSVTVNVTAAPTGSTTQVFFSGQTIADIVVVGSNITWYPTALDATNGTNALSFSDLLVNNTTYYATQTIGGCESDSSLAVTVTVTLEVSDFDAASFKVYPNPVMDILNITHAFNISTVEVYNAIGQQVIVKTINQSAGTVDMSRLSRGTYFVKVTIDNAVKTVKVIKK